MRAALDANVLFPFTLRDILLRAAAAGCYQVYSSEQILVEATHNLVETGTMVRRPPTTLEDPLRRLERVTPRFVGMVRAKLGRV